MSNSRRKCSFCGERKPTETMFIRGTQAFCNNDHFVEYAVRHSKRLIKKGDAIRRSESNKALREAKERVKTLSEWKRDAQFWFNKFIRLRDANDPCISCGRHHDGQYHAGHYRSTGACPELRFEEDNCHKQCAPCNNHLSGNLTNYRPRLIDKIGIERVEWLEGPHEAKKYTIDELKSLISKYKEKVKPL